MRYACGMPVATATPSPAKLPSSALEDMAPGPLNVAPSQGDTKQTETQIANYVQHLFYRARSLRRPLIAQWKLNYRTLHNKTWAPRAEAWMPSPEISQVFPVIFSSVAWMTDQRPTIETTAAPQPFSEYADFYQSLSQDMNSVLNACFMGNSLDLEISKCLWDAFTYGIGYFKTTWEPWLADGIGDTAFRRITPYNIYPDPFATSMEDMTYIVEAKQLTISDVDRSYPGARGRLASGMNIETDEQPHVLDETVSQSMARVRLGNLPTATNTRYSLTDTPRDRGIEDDPTVTVLEAWVRHHKTEDTDDPLVKKVRDVWRCIVTCGNVVLLDYDAGDVNAYGTHPYDRMVLTDMGEFYGPSVVGMLDSPQESIGRLVEAIMSNIALMGNPVLRESPRSRSRGKRITNRPGQRIEAEDTEVEWLNPPQMHPQMSVDLIQFFKGEIESISGLSAMVRGFSPGGRNSAGVLDQVQDAAFVRVRASLRQLEAALRGVCAKMCANIAEFYTEPRHMAIQGQDGQKFQLALRSRHFYTRDADDPDERIPLRFTLLADAGSQLPTSKQARAADAERLFALGAIDVYELLKAKQWPNYSIVAKRVMDQMSAGQSQAPAKRTATRS